MAEDMTAPKSMYIGSIARVEDGVVSSPSSLHVQYRPTITVSKKEAFLPISMSKNQPRRMSLRRSTNSSNFLTLRRKPLCNVPNGKVYEETEDEKKELCLS